MNRAVGRPDFRLANHHRRQALVCSRSRLQMLLRQLDEDVLEARAADLEAQHAPAPGQAPTTSSSTSCFLSRQLHRTVLCVIDRRIRMRSRPARPRCPSRQPIERHRHVVEPLDSSLSVCRSPRAACRPVLMIRMSSHSSSASLEDLRRQHDGPPAGRLRAQLVHDARFRIGSMPVENSSRNTTGVSTMNTLATCTRRREAAAQVLHLACRPPRQPEFLHHVVRRARDTGRRAGRGIARTSAGCRGPSGTAPRLS